MPKCHLHGGRDKVLGRSNKAVHQSGHEHQGISNKDNGSVCEDLAAYNSLVYPLHRGA